MLATLRRYVGARQHVARNYGLNELCFPGRLQIDKHVEREILNHRRLSAHTNVITFREVGAAGVCSALPGAAWRRSDEGTATAPLLLVAANYPWSCLTLTPDLAARAVGSPACPPDVGVSDQHPPGHCDGLRARRCAAAATCLLTPRSTR